MAAPKVAVVGAGISGLSVAWRLLQEGFTNLVVYSDNFSPHTLSDTAAAILVPYSLLVTEDKQYLEVQRNWFEKTFKYFLEVYQSPKASGAGVSLVPGYQVERDDNGGMEGPWYKDIVIGFRRVDQEECKNMNLPTDQPETWFYTTFVVNCNQYLPWLTDCIRSKGVPIIKRHVVDLNDVLTDSDIVVNCSGLASRELAHDNGLQPVFGQGMSVKAPWLKYFIFDITGDHYILIVPRPDNSVMLGGTTIENLDSGEVKPDISKKITEETAQYVPSLKRAPIIKEWAGARPCRKKIRVESEKLQNGVVIHNYGHGGNGINYSWGCADTVCQLVKEATAKTDLPKSLL